MALDNSLRQDKRLANGKIGELLVELELTARGWHVERLDGGTKAANGDLVALKGKFRSVIQVKSNGTQKDRAFLGYAANFINKRLNFFNSKDSVIETDFVVSVTGGHKDPQFFVFSVDEAEALAQKIADDWYATKTRKGAQRSANFPISPKTDSLKDFKDRWDKLEAET